MGISDLSLLLATVLLAVLWWRRCCRTGGGAKNLPPGPPGWPVVGNLFQVVLQRRAFMYVVRDLREKYGPVFTMQMGQRTLVIITSAELIHEALVQRGPQFASRPEDSPTRLLFSVGKCTVNSAPYGPLWRALRRNFVAEIVTPAKVRQFGWIRDWAIGNHLQRLRREREGAGAVEVMANCRLTVCSILACICFGARVPESMVQQIEAVLKEVMMMSTLKLPDFLPALTPLFRSQRDAARNLRKRQMALLAPLVRDRLAFLQCGGDQKRYTGDTEMVSPVGSAYIDSLFELKPAGRGALGEEELVTLCSEVMSAGTDTSTTALEWALLHLVLDQGIQERLYDEIAVRLGAGECNIGQAKINITESDVENMPYLQAVVKETLRRHPPSHFVLSHAATEDTELGGYHIPAGATVEFYTAWLTENPATWKDPDAYRPERFLEGGDGCDTDLTGARGVRMMPFGVGRRICPAASLGMLHVQLMLARMVWEFRWMPVPGEAPPTTEETFAFTMVMKNPLRAAIVDRQH